MLQGVCSRAAPGHALALRLHLLLGLQASRYPIHHIRWDRAASFKIHQERRPHAMQYSRAGLQAKAPLYVSALPAYFLLPGIQQHMQVNRITTPQRMRAFKHISR